VISAA